MNQQNPVFELQEPIAIVIDAAWRTVRRECDLERATLRWENILETLDAKDIAVGLAIMLAENGWARNYSPIEDQSG